MRKLIALALMVLAGSLSTQAVAKGCDVGGQDVPCATQNGHYRIRMPDGPGPFPTVVYLYGSLGNSARTLSHDGFVQAFVERGYAVIVPAALDVRYKDGLGSGWHLRNERIRSKRNEIAFIEEVLVDAEIRHRINRNRVLIAGMSRGGFLTWEIACHNPTLAAAYAPIAAGYLGSMPERCQRPVRILHTHGRSDEIVPLDPDRSWASGGATMQPLNDALETMARTAGCSPLGAEDRLREYDRRHWENCTYGASVDLLLHKAGHTIPLSWYSTVIDWFEGAGSETPETGGGTARFMSVGGEEGRFKSSGSRGNRFRTVGE